MNVEITQELLQVTIYHEGEMERLNVPIPVEQAGQPLVSAFTNIWYDLATGRERVSDKYVTQGVSLQRRAGSVWVGRVLIVVHVLGFCTLSSHLRHDRTEHQPRELQIWNTVAKCCRSRRGRAREGSDEVSLLFSDRLQLRNNEVLAAGGHEQRLVRLWSSQQSAHKEDLPKVMAVLWGMQEEHVTNCLDYEVGIRASVAWVHSIQGALDNKSTDCFPTALRVRHQVSPHKDFFLRCWFSLKARVPV
jgi:hypothetical protein